MKAVTEYYPDKDILFIKVFDGYDYKISLELEEGIILDFDMYNNLIALEILYASEIFKLKDNDLLSHIKKLDMNVEATDKLIIVKVKIEFNVQSGSSSLKSIVLNTIKVPKSALHDIPSVDMKIKIDENSICLHLTIGVHVHDKRFEQSFNSLTANNSGLPNLEAELATA